jgi:hypothetical protein
VFGALLRGVPARIGFWTLSIDPKNFTGAMAYIMLLRPAE